MSVKLLPGSRIAISFYVCRGVPGYGEGAFIDTMRYLNNYAIYTTEEDSTCQIYFSFSKTDVLVTEQTADFNSGCGFGHAVIATGYLRKKSRKVPVIKDLLRTD